MKISTLGEQAEREQRVVREEARVRREEFLSRLAATIGIVPNVPP